RFDHRRRRQLDCFLGLEAVACDCDDRQLIWCDPPLLDKLSGDRNRHSTSGLGEYTFGLGEQSDTGSDLVVGYVFGPAAAGDYNVPRVISVGGIADGKGFGDCIRFDGPNIADAALHRIHDWIAAACLCSKYASVCIILQQTKLLEFLQAFVNLTYQRSSGHRHNHSGRVAPAELFGYLVSEGLRSLTVEWTEIYIHQSPGVP